MVRAAVGADPHLVASLYDEWLLAQKAADRLRAERNANANALKGKIAADERLRVIAEGKSLKEQLVTAEAAVADLDARMQAEAAKLPNSTHPDSPIGKEARPSPVCEIAYAIHGSLEKDSPLKFLLS